MKNRHHPKVAQPTKNAVIEGRISTTGKGLGFVKDPEGGEDIRIEAGFLNTALHGDLVRVIAQPRKKGGEKTGEVANIIKRARTRFVGTIEKENGITFVLPDERKMYTDIVLKDAPVTLVNDDKVFVELVSFDDPQKNPVGRLIEVIGKKGEHEAEIRSIILGNNIDDSFPENVEKEAETIHARHDMSDTAGREDFRGTLTFTIDPVDAKDFDDALSFKYLGGDTFEVGVHIADVSHYVETASALDAEAKKRAFSVYLVDRTIPMLPETLSNDLCSLKPDVDRMTFSVWWTLKRDGTVVSEHFGKSVIHSKRRFTYEEAQETHDDPTQPLHDELSILNGMAKRMRDRRSNAGAIDFEQHEVRFELADDGVPLSVFTKERLDTHKLIEEFMLLANVSVAEYIRNNYGGKPAHGGSASGGNKQHAFIYRVHDHPDKDKLHDLALFVRAAGHTLSLSPKGTVSGAELNRLFKEVEGSPEEDLIKTAGLRTMAKAAYSTWNIGHFGLAIPSYTHFTSPIRRYADLLVHRLLSIALTKKTLPNNDILLYSKIAESISAREIDVIGAERDSVKYKQVEYMSSRIGQTFDAVISGVSDWGIFVAERETKAEGLIRMKSLPSDFYELEPKKYRVIGKKTKKTFALGDTLKVKVVAADVDKKIIDYALA